MIFYFTHASIILSLASVLSIIGYLTYWTHRSNGLGSYANFMGAIFVSIVFLILLAVYLLSLLRKLPMISFQIIFLVITAVFVYLSFDPREFGDLRIMAIFFSAFGILSLIGTLLRGFRKPAS